jgi:hypothetical protein
MDYKERLIKELRDLPNEMIDEVIDFIGYLKSKESKGRVEKKVDILDTGDNPLLSLVGIEESNHPHDLAQNHDKYIYGDL